MPLLTVVPPMPGAEPRCRHPPAKRCARALAKRVTQTGEAAGTAYLFHDDLIEAAAAAALHGRASVREISA